MFLVCSQTQLHFFLFKLLSENFPDGLEMSLFRLPVLPDKRSRTAR